MEATRVSVHQDSLLLLPSPDLSRGSVQDRVSETQRSHLCRSIFNNEKYVFDPCPKDSGGEGILPRTGMTWDLQGDEGGCAELGVV